MADKAMDAQDVISDIQDEIPEGTLPSDTTVFVEVDGMFYPVTDVSYDKFDENIVLHVGEPED